MFVFTIPATGHVNSMLYMIELLSNKLREENRTVYVFTTEKYKNLVENVGGSVILYPFKDEDIDLSQGSHLIPFSASVLEFSEAILDKLIKYQKSLKPKCIIHDSAAYWGKLLGYLTDTPTVGFCSYLYPMNRETKSLYVSNFGFSTVKELKFLTTRNSIASRLRDKYNIPFIMSITETLTSVENTNLIGYSSFIQPGDLTNKHFVHVGHLSLMRPATEGLIKPPDGRTLYVSLGTIASSNIRFWLKLIKDFKGSAWNICVSDSTGVIRKILSGVFTIKRDGEWYKLNDAQCNNLYIADYINQREFLKHCDVYLTACGQNSVAEAVFTGTPMLLFPQQGEQQIVADRLEKLNLGLAYKNKNNILNRVNEVLLLKENFNSNLIEKFTHIDEELILNKIFEAESEGHYIRYDLRT